MNRKIIRKMKTMMVMMRMKQVMIQNVQKYHIESYFMIYNGQMKQIIIEWGLVKM